MPKIAFSSDDLPAALNDRQRFALWRDLCNERFGALLDISRTDDGPLSLHCEFGLLGGVTVAEFKGTCTQVRRGPHAVKADGNDGFVFFVNRGPTRIALAQKGRDVVLGSRAAGLMTHAEPGAFSGDAHNARYVLTLPRIRLLDLVAHPEDLVATALDPDSAPLRLLRQYLDLVAGPQGFANDPAVADHVGRTITDLIGLALGARRQAAEIAGATGLRAARLETIAAQIAAGFADPGFSSERVARRLGVTRRYVQDLLQETGVSFTERVTELRLQKVRQMIESGDPDRIRITEIAHAVGFNDISYFNRRFRQRFGASPTAFRAARKMPR